LIKTDQKLQNYLAAGKIEKALALSIRLDRPRQTRKTLEILRKRSMLETALANLNLDDRNALFRMLVQWNSYGMFSSLAQEVLRHLLQEALVNGRPLAADKCAGIISFSDKHYQRLDKLESRLAVVDLMLQKM
jgi:Utp13 specific WD40 associated domain